MEKVRKFFVIGFDGTWIPVLPDLVKISCRKVYGIGDEKIDCMGHVLVFNFAPIERIAP